MKKYIRIMRIDHWIKQLFIFPGVVAAVALTGVDFSLSLIQNLICGFFATCLIASANYVINEWLDAEFDKFHPTKKHRSVVENNVKAFVVYIIYVFLILCGFLVAYFLTHNMPLLLMLVWLWVMGILYNVRPIRTKDVPFIDVLTESVNNAIRLLIGWFIVSDEFLPPISIVIGYWLAGAFLMATKRFAEYRMINDAELAGRYRKSFKYYTLKSLLLSSFFYAMCSVFFVGIFLVKYKIELILFMPAFIGLFCYYFWIAFKEDSAAQKPEKLFHEKGLVVYVGGLIILFIILMFVHIPGLYNLMSDSLLHF